MTAQLETYKCAHIKANLIDRAHALGSMVTMKSLKGFRTELHTETELCVACTASAINFLKSLEAPI